MTPGSAARWTIAVAILTSGLVAMFTTLGVRSALADDGLSSPDLVVHASSDATDAIPKGGAMTYTLTVENVGRATAHGVTVTFSLPREVIPIYLPPTMDDGTCSAVGIDPGSTYAVFCSRRTLGAGRTATVTIDVRIDRDRPCGTIRAKATVAATDELSSARHNDTAAHSDDVRCEASMRIEHPAQAFARVGETTSSLFELVNDGETTLRDLRLNGPGCSIGSVGSGLRPGSRRAIRCVRRITGPGDARLVIHLTAASPEGRRLHLTATARVAVIHPSITVSVPASRVSGRVGSSTSYPIVITNSGDSPLTDLTVRRSGAGIVGRVPSLGAGTRITLIATDRLGAEHIQTDHILVSGTDRSGRRVSATATTTITVFTARVRDHRPSTAFTGSWATDRVTAAAVLLVIGVGMLVLGRRRCALPSRN